MKKLFFSLLLVFGAMATTQAQILFWEVANIDNQAGSNWNYKMSDGNGNVAYALNVQFNSPQSGFINNFSLPLQWAAEDENGCGGDGFYNVGNGFVPFFCVAPGAFLSYSLQPIFPTNNWTLSVQLF